MVKVQVAINRKILSHAQPSEIGIKSNAIVSEYREGAHFNNADRYLRYPQGKSISPPRVKEEIPLLVEDWKLLNGQCYLRHAIKKDSGGSKIGTRQSYVSGSGCRSEIRTVPFMMWTNCLIEFTTWKVVELSSPVDISSMKSAFAGPTSISPSPLFTSGNTLSLPTGDAPNHLISYNVYLQLRIKHPSHSQ
ncbi:HIT zinc finger [Striga asiatica]|uniref:HIT zinc finger n=1 Tax=Striga asiatica TaxID=4170 RepID=A0A5A7QST6_STRAF|nr:HIT zinc finger [Striga asiatica]